MLYEGRERRRHQRIDMNLPVQAKRLISPEDAGFKEAVTRNISLGGAYFTTSDFNLAPQEEIVVSISVPKERTRLFPFSRLAGRAKVIRVEQFGQQRWQGVALQFADDMTYLSAAPAY